MMCCAKRLLCCKDTKIKRTLLLIHQEDPRSGISTKIGGPIGVVVWVKESKNLENNLVLYVVRNVKMICSN